MDDNPIKQAEENVMFEVGPESTPPGAADFSMDRSKRDFLGGGGIEKQKKESPFQRLNKDSNKDLQIRVNGFLNGASKGAEVDERKFQSRLSREDYYCYAAQEGNVVQGAIDAELTNNGMVIISRMRTDSEVSKRHLEDNGKTLGQSMFENMVGDLKEKGAKGIKAEVTQDGYQFLKRMSGQGLIALTRDETIEGTDFHLIEGNLAA